MLDQRLFRRLRKSDEEALKDLCDADTRWRQYYRDHQAWLKRALEDLRGTGRAAFGCFSAVPSSAGGFLSHLDACIFLKVSEFDNSAELKNLVFRNDGTTNKLSEQSMSAAVRLIEKTARYCETRDISKLEIELPQSEHTLISLFLHQGFRVAALRERYYPGQSVCILEKKVGGAYYADPFESVQLGKWLLRAILPCKVMEPKPFWFKDGDGVPYLPFEIFPTHPAFSNINPVGFEKRLQGWMMLLDEPDLCTEPQINEIAQSEIRHDGDLHYVLAHALSLQSRTLLKQSGISCFTLDEVKIIAGGERSSLSIPLQRSAVGGILTVLEQERVHQYAEYNSEFVYYLLSGIGGAIPEHERANSLLAVYCPSWSDRKSGIVAIADIHQIAKSSFEEAFNLYKDIPKALTKGDLEYYRTRNDKDRIYVLKCSKLHLLPRRLDFDEPLWKNQENMRDYISRELEETNSAYISEQTCESLRQHLSKGDESIGKAKPGVTRRIVPTSDHRAMKILFLAANPSGTTHLDLEEELRSVNLELRATKFRDAITLVAHHAVRPDDLIRYVREEKPNVIHFSGHGSTKGIILRNDKDQFQAVEGPNLKRFLEGRGVDLVVLNACFSSVQGNTIHGAVKAVVGTTDAVEDEAARRFAVAFYRSLGNGLSVGEAFRDGKDAADIHGFVDVFQNRGELDITFFG